MTLRSPDETRLEGADIGVVIAYFLVVIGVGVLAMWKANRSSVSGYFLAGRSMLWLPVGASLFVSNIGSEHYIGLAGSAAARGISVGAWEQNALILLQLMAWIFVPVYIASGIYTMPEYLSKRFGGNRLRIYFAFLSLVLYIFTKCSVNLYTGGLFIQQSLKWNLYLCVVILIFITAILTITGGLTAVIYTDTLQAGLMIAGGLVITGFSFSEVGGLAGVYSKYPQAIPNITVPNTTCHVPDPHAFTMLRSADSDHVPWLGFVIGQTPGSIWYFCADQVIVQRTLAAKSLSHAQGAALLAGIIKTLPMFMMVFPGMISRILYPDEVGCVDPEECYRICQSYAGCSNIAYPKLVLGLLPVGLRGLMMAVIIAALMSDLDSIFNSASTMFTIDVWKRFRKNISVKEQMIVGRLFVIVMTAIAVAWVPVVKETQGGQLFIYIQEVTNYLAPPFAMTFLLGVLVPRVNEKGAFWGLMAAFVTGVTRLILVFIFPKPDGCGREDNRPAIVKDFHYMYFSFFIFMLTGVVSVVVSLFTEKPDEKLLWRTTYWTRFAPRDKEPETDYDVGVAMAVTNVDRDEDSQTSASEDIVNGSAVAESEDVTSDSCEHGPESRVRNKKDIRLKHRLFQIVCGYTSKKDDADTEAVRKMREHLLKVSDLKQDPRVLIGLRIGLILILTLGTSLYVFWSTWKLEV